MRMKLQIRPYETKRQPTAMLGDGGVRMTKGWLAGGVVVRSGFFFEEIDDDVWGKKWENRERRGGWSELKVAARSTARGVREGEITADVGESGG